MWQPKYRDYEEFRKILINKKIVEWNEDKLILDDGVEVTIVCSEQDCCANASGTFSDVKLDAMITDVSYPEVVSIDDWDTTINKATIKVFHNQNIIAKADVTADAGNGGYYYSVGSFLIKDIHYPVVNA